MIGTSSGDSGCDGGGGGAHSRHRISLLFPGILVEDNEESYLI